ncbi:MAG: Ig-like domain-containing protein [Lachnospiraceae bacterium]|nr:Ig-like domain-containing protein [Lachnospiraceae bacterium]
MRKFSEFHYSERARKSKRIPGAGQLFAALALCILLGVLGTPVQAAISEANLSVSAEKSGEEETSIEEGEEEETSAQDTEEESSGEEETETSEEESSGGEETETEAIPVLSKTELTLEVGLTETLTVTDLPDGVKTASWTSSDTTLASVSSKGKIKAKKPGTVTVTVALTDGTALTCQVTIPEVSLNAESVSLLVGKTKKLKVSGSGAAVTWSSSKPEKVSVDENGKVTALAYGSSTITAKIGSTKLKCTVKVYDPQPSRTSLYLLKGDTATLKVSQCSGTVTWSSSSTKVASVSQSGVVTAKKDGTATIKMKVNGTTVTCSVTVATAKLAVTQKNMVTGGSYKIKVSGSAKKGTWSSSDTSKLTVSSGGTCKAKKTGEVTVTYTVGDSELSCYIVIAKKGATNTFGTTVSQASVGISSLRNLALGSSSRYRFLQGSCTDGTYGYFLLGDKNYQPYCAIIKVRLSDWKVVKKKTGLKLYHGNDMTYKSGMLLIANGDGNAQTITYVSASTLKIKKTRTLSEKIYALAYNAKRKQYVVAVSGTSNLIIKDSSWKTVRTFTHLQKSGYTRQGIDCDDSYIYVLQSYLAKSKTRILVYDWKGNYVTQIQISGKLEAESLFHVGNQFIISYNDASYSGGTIRTTAMKRYYLVRYAASGGTGTQAGKMVKTGKGFTTASCKYKKTGYSFKGWTATRSSDGKTAYRNKTTKKIKWYKAGSQPKGYELYVISAKKKVSSMSSTPGDCITLTAVWKKKS